MNSNPTNYGLKDVLNSRKVWAAVLLVLVSVIGSQVPGFQLNVDQAAALTVIIASYIVGVAIDPGANAGNWRGMIKSRKFWAAVVGLVVIFLDAFHVALPMGLSKDQLIMLAAGLGSYIAGVGVEGLVRKLPSKTMP